VFIFVLSLAVGLAVGLMLAWHLYLVLSGQTTIEFYYNRFRGQIAKERGEVYYNEFDLGYRRNWEFFFGKGRCVRFHSTPDCFLFTLLTFKPLRFWFSWLLPALAPPPGSTHNSFYFISILLFPPYTTRRC
jgi:hypothetical protein